MSRESLSYAGVRTLVTGASGFIGRWIARFLTIERAEVVLAVRDDRAMRDVAATYGIRGTIRVVDFTEAEAIDVLVREVQPTVTFNALGYGVDRGETDSGSMAAVNAVAVGQLVGAISRLQSPEWRGTRLVHLGSALEYGDVGGKLDEAVPARPNTAYGRTKLEGTLAVCGGASDGLRAITARLFTVYGPGEHPGRLLPSLIAGRRTQQRVLLSAGTQRRDFTYVGDVAEGLLRLGLSNAPPGWIVNLATGRLLSVREFAETAARALGMPLEELEFGAVGTYAGEMEHRDVSTRRLETLLSWVPKTSIRDGVRATWDFLSTEMRVPR